MRMRTILLALVLGGGALVLVTGGATAEWLVTTDGSKVEIAGPWQVQGKRVTFTLPNGTLGSMPLAAVDLEASTALAAALAEADRPAAPAVEKPKAVMVITDADVGHPNRRSEDETGAAEAPAPSPSPQLRVAGWRESVDLSRNSVRIIGDLQNPTENPATSIRLAVKLYDETGELLETSDASLERGFLNPGASVRFEAEFLDTLSYDSVQFEIQSRGFMANPPADEPAEGVEDSEEEAGQA